MNADNTKDSREQERRMHAEMLDSIDEELEMEIDDDRMDALVAEATERAGEGRDLRGCENIPASLPASVARPV